MTDSKAWKALQPGDIVDVVAPASICKKEELKAGIEYLRSLGLQPRVPKDLFKRKFFFSNTDEYRFEHLKEVLCARDSKALWCTRGGYGSLRLLPELQKLKRPNQVKLLIGLSDITSLHIFLNQSWNWPSVHGPMLSRLGRGQSPAQEYREIKGLIFGTLSEIEFRNLKPLNAAARKSKTIRASVVGGNLETIAGAQGTPWCLKPEGKILFFEEVNERGYRVDRKFQSFLQNGMFKKARAVVFGDFIGGAEPDTGKKMWKEALQDLADCLGIPVLTGIRSGHGPLQRPVPFNTKSELITGHNPKLICSTGVER